MDAQIIVAVACTIAGALIVAALLAWRFYVRVPVGQVLLVRGSRGDVRLSRTGMFAWPFTVVVEPVDLRTTRLVVQRRGKDGLRCMDRIRVSITVHFLISVVPVAEEIDKAAQVVGIAHLADEAALGRLFAGKVEEAVASTVAMFRYREIVRDRERARDDMLKVLGPPMWGFDVRDAAIVELEQVPIELLDPNDMFDAEAIRTISEATMEEALRRSDTERQIAMQIARQELDTREAEERLERARRT